MSVSERSLWHRLGNSIPFHVGLLFLFLLVTKGHPVPEPVTEYLYLPCLMKQYNPGYIPGDWTLAGPFYEHMVFNVSFGWLTLFMSLETVGWLGRILCWLIMSLALLLLGQRLRLPAWLTSLAIVVWLLRDQSLVASSWMIGGFEAKVVAYAFLVGSLNLFLRDRTHLGSFLLGLSFSFHPAVGMWGGLATGLTLLLLRTPVKQLAVMAGYVILGALPGLIATTMLLSQPSANSAEAWKFIILTQAPQHFAPDSWPLREILLAYLLFLFNWLSARTYRDDRALQFLFYFQLGLGLFFTIGLWWWWAGYYKLLRYFPFRLFPIFVLLCFCLQVVYAYHHHARKALSTVAMVVGFMGVMSLGNPLGRLMDQVNETRRLWKAQRGDLFDALRWVRKNTPKDSVVIQPPWMSEAIHLAQRPQVANWWANRYDKLVEWKARLDALVGEIPRGKPEEKVALMKKRYNNLSTEQIRNIVSRYGGQYLVSKGSYSFPVLFKTKTYKVYDLRSLTNLRRTQQRK